MTKEQQSLSWACLPKEARDEIKELFNKANNTDNFAVIGAYVKIFGHHNLTSDTEPEEVLMTSKVEVTELYKRALNEDFVISGGARLQLSRGIRFALKKLFGDKCLPDKETCEENLQVEQSSVQGEPKFKVGDKVRKTSWDKDTTISMVEWHGTWETFVYHFKEQEYGFNCHKENDLALVSKRAKDPNFSIGDKVQLQIDWCRLLKGTLLTIKDIPTIDRDNTFMYSFEETDEYIRETMLEPYPEPETKMTEERYQYLNSLSIEEYDKETSSAEQTAFCDYQQKYHPDEVVYWQTHSNDTPETKDNMEERELNLAELLKGCEGETAYFAAFGEVVITSIKGDRIEVKQHYGNDSPKFIFNNKGQWFLGDSSQSASLYPSRTLYEKYPLDAYSAWEEWKELRKPKRWGAKLGDLYYCFDECLDVREEIESADYKDNISWNVGNYFRSKEETQEAIKVVKECLEKFHEKNK